MRVAVSQQYIVTLIVAAVIGVSPLAAEPAGLRSYQAPIGESSISGISSGAFMAVQFGTAWSSVIKGVGVVAGGPYWCAKADAFDAVTGYWGPIWRATGACMKGPATDLHTSDFTAKADAKAAAGEIDPLSNVKRQKIYLFHGYNDAVVDKAATDATADFYRHYMGDANRGNLFYQTALGAGHSFVVTRQDAPGLNDCKGNAEPYIDQCGYDQAGIILQHIYGRLNRPNPAQLAGSVKSFDQSVYTGPDVPDALSMGDTGYVFVPQDCEQGAPCRVHVALHGCKQDVGDIGRRFVDEAGYNAWADTNHLIVLYPQTKASPYLPGNPQACWDWWSYVDHEDSYVTKSGSQIRAIKAMLDALTAGSPASDDATASSLSAPQWVTAIDASDTGIDLAWLPVDGVTAYRVWRAGTDGAFQRIGEVTGASFADSGLTPQTTYRWRVSAVRNGTEGPASEDAIGTTQSPPPRCNDPGSCPIAK
ncbi:fibronectin type III domain-containing protein [Bradyrhizobium sp. Ec3.3]|uniref:extracellular catalytic domain type 2 short-chain-length polyhydroxyalkanoate depolymerase n=1 Tax=Bradyrhizobium sp. Ec3.3 TaxID=189753 RepID=UPI000410346F|nr:PHB depolymerase family esterase [Bradyrhizobium sp. Ec3.3]